MSIVSLILSISILTGYSGNFREGDWVNYTNFRYVTSVAMDQNIVYFGTTGGVLRYDRYAEKWLDPMTVTDGLPHSQIDNIAYDPTEDKVWVITPLGVAYYQVTFERWYHDFQFPSGLARNDFRRSQFVLLNTEFGYFYQDGFLSDIHNQQFELTRGKDDGFDKLYVGTWGAGPVIIDTRYNDLKMIPFGPYSENITAVVMIDDQLWLGDGASSLTSGAISVFDMYNDSWRWHQPRYTDGLGSARLVSGSGDDKNIWLVTEYGLVNYNIGDDRFTTFADHANMPSTDMLSVAVFDDIVIAGTDNGIGYVDKKKRKKKNDKTDNDTIPENHIDRERFLGWDIYDLEIFGDYLYMASDHGAMRKNITENTEFEYVDTPDKQLSAAVYDITEHHDTLYFATNRDIVLIDTRTGASDVIMDPSYFDRWHLRKITADSKHIWAATDIGLWRYRLSDGYERLYTVGDGMISDDVRDLTLDGDFLWLATPKGLIRFYWNDPGRGD